MGDTANSSVPVFGINSPPTTPNARGTQSIPTTARHVTGTNTAYFNVGTPGNNWSPHRTPTANLGDWAPGAGTENKPFDIKEWSVDGRKVTKELRSFDGDMAAYDNWRRRIRDHFVSVNCNDATVFDLIEQQKTPIDWNLLATTRVAELPYLNWSWVSTHLWSFTGALGRQPLDKQVEPCRRPRVQWTRALARSLSPELRRILKDGQR